MNMDKFRKTSFPFIFTCSLVSLIIHANDTLHNSQTIRDGETLISSGGVFELGFFTPGNSSNRYVGIWYKNITVKTYVWVANRQAPLPTNSGVLKLTAQGVLAIFNDTNGTIIWSSNTSTSVLASIQNPSAQLLDSGNLVVKDVNDSRPENFLWQSFDNPTDTLLPGMNFGWNLATGVESYLSSWRSNDDPSPSLYTAHLDPTGYPQLLNVRSGYVVLYRIGPWNGLRWSGTADFNNNDGIYRLTLEMDKNVVKYREDILQPSFYTRITMNPYGVSSRFTWNPRIQDWTIYSNVPMDSCDNYGLCGAHGSCTIGNSPPCACLDRFVPKDPGSWSRADWSNGCVRRASLNCSDDVFLKYSGIKLPDSRNSSYNDRIIRLADCEGECKRNCSCVAYTQLNISGSGSGCLFYHGNLVDIRTMAQAGQELYIRMASSESPIESRSKGRKRVILIVSITLVAGIGLVCLSLYLIFTWRRKKDPRLRNEVAVVGPLSGDHVVGDGDLPFFSLSTILAATNNFSIINKLGQGGFGPVYRGMLEDGQEIAVKRLSKTSSQGVDELKNEVILIAKLQHRNLVRTLGCCVEGDENMLVYEYMINKSLDSILFDETKSMQLDWNKRFNIINGIAKGLLYLHQDSRLRIIHRDLKTSNILLDADMNPKISDFGLARSFGGNETEARTRRVVGTYGYMSPEYAIDGLFSVKSDVFSFGVLVLEIVSGKKNRGYFLRDDNQNLIEHAWKLYKEDNSSKLVDTCLGDSFDLSQVLRSIHVGLLCVQKYHEDRPNMSSVIFMLGNEVALLPPKQPGFFTKRNTSIGPGPNSSNTTNSENQVTVTCVEGR